MDPHVSIILASYNGRDLVRRCLTSIYEHIRGPGFEVIVVDNASWDGTPQMITASFPQVRLVRRTINAGFAAAVNQGLSLGRGSHFMLLNPDCELGEDILPPAIRFLEEHPDTGVLAPKILNEDGTVQPSCRSFPGFGTALFNRQSLLTRLFPRNRLARHYLLTDLDHDAIADVDWVSAACWLMPRATYERVGPLDEGYFWSVEDVDYCQRVHKAGPRVVYFPLVHVRHTVHASATSARARSILEHHRGMWRYYKTYMRPRRFLGRALLDGAVWAGIHLRCGVHLAGALVARALRGPLGP